MSGYKRQLAAIMFTDIVGYTALMGKNTQKAMDLVRRSKEIQKALVTQHNGKWIKEMGDGALMVFETAMDAVNCGLDIQRSSRESIEADFRIGIHIGDITIEENDAYGDGVNVASRLESIADPGGIYISDSVEKAIRGLSDVQAKYLGELKLKNVDYDVRTYALQGRNLPIPDQRENKNLSGKFLAELQRRGVFRAGIIYLLISIAVILLIPDAIVQFNMPPWFEIAVYVVLIIAFPVAMYLAWHYEFSPDGLIKTSSQQSWRNPYPLSQRKPLTSNLIIIGVGLITIILLIYPKLSEPLISDGTAEGDKSVSMDASGSDSPVMGSADKTIAVLPFENMSHDKNQEYFSEGMMVEIINQLVQVKNLKVVPRNSVMQYKGTTKTIREIASELGVSSILTGNVRKSGDRIRIDVQLIDGMSGIILWSELFDRNFEEIFRIQNEIARRVTNKLEVNLQDEVRTRIMIRPTENMEAYNLYLQAVYHYYSYTHESSSRAEVLFEKVIDMDAGFANAYVYLGSLKSNFHWASKNPRVTSSREAVEVALPYYEKALEIDPDNILAHKFMCQMYLSYEWEFEKALEEYETVKQLEPGYYSFELLWAYGRIEELGRLTEKQVRIDPLNIETWLWRIYYLVFIKERKMALDHIEMLLKRDLQSYYVGIGEAYLYLGMYKEAIEMMYNYFNDFPNFRPPRTLCVLAIANYYMGYREKVGLYIDEIKKRAEKNPAGSPYYYISMIYAQTGDSESTFSWLEEAFQDHEPKMVEIKTNSMFDPLREDPRFQEILDRIGFPD